VVNTAASRAHCVFRHHEALAIVAAVESGKEPAMSRRVAWMSCLLLLAMAACRREAGPPGTPAVTPAATTAPATAAVRPALQDVIEQDPRYVVGISYPAVANQYPGLAAELRRYAEAARSELMQAVHGLGTDKPSAPYELSLAFTELSATPKLVTIAADGSTYTGGAHGNPLVARFNWLPGDQRLLTAQALFPDAKAWPALSAFVREQLHAALSQRADADEMPPAEREAFVRNAGRMIDEGTEPEASNFAQFEPVLGPDARIQALRFVFPPYQVGPYADGTQTVDVPASELAPLLAPAYRDLFAGG